MIPKPVNFPLTSFHGSDTAAFDDAKSLRSNELERNETFNGHKQNRIRVFYEKFRQSLISLIFDFGGIVAGFLIALYSGIFALAPWIIAVYPGILSMRGVTGGLMSARISTGLHTGTMNASVRKNTDEFYSLWHATITLTIGGSIILSLVTIIFGTLFWYSPSEHMFIILGVIIATMFLSLFAAAPVTVLVSILSYRKGLDPDITVYPVMSTFADIIVSGSYVLMLFSIFTMGIQGLIIVGGLSSASILYVSYILARHLRDSSFVKTIKESVLTMFIVTFIVNITGTFLYSISESLGSRPNLYMVYPAMIDTVGDVGSIVGSTATTKLALGAIDSKLRSIKDHWIEVGAAWAASLVMFLAYALISGLTFALPPLESLDLILVCQVTNVMSVPCIILISYILAIWTHRRGWDPDNFVVPIESSLADSISTLSLLIAISIFPF